MEDLSVYNGRLARIIARINGHQHPIGIIVRLLHDDTCKPDEIKAVTKRDFWWITSEEFKTIAHEQTH